MPIERTFEPDLQQDAICEFLTNIDEPKDTYSTTDAVRSEWEGDGYRYRAIRAVHIPIPLPRRTFETTRFEVSTAAGRLLHTIDVTDPVDHPMVLQINALLLLHEAIDEGLAQDIEDAFLHADLDDVDAAEANFLSGGLKPTQYQVLFSFDLVRTGPPSRRKINLDAFLNQMQTYQDTNGQPLYQLSDGEFVGHTCDAPDHADDPAYTLIGDPDHPTEAIANAERPRHPSCDQLEVTDHRIGTAFQYYEWETRWEMRDVRIGKCRIMRTKLPIVYHRVTKQALWGYVLTEHSLTEYFQKAIRACLIEAAVSTAVLAIVTGGMGIAAAAAAFASSCQQCLERKISDVVQCLFSGLKLVKEEGGWHEGIV